MIEQRTLQTWKVVGVRSSIKILLPVFTNFTEKHQRRKHFTEKYQRRKLHRLQLYWKDFKHQRRKLKLATLLKRFQTQAFFCELAKYFQAYYSIEPLWTAASETFSNRYETREAGHMNFPITTARSLCFQNIEEWWLTHVRLIFSL